MLGPEAQEILRTLFQKGLLASIIVWICAGVMSILLLRARRHQKAGPGHDPVSPERATVPDTVKAAIARARVQRRLPFSQRLFAEIWEDLDIRFLGDVGAKLETIVAAFRHGFITLQDLEHRFDLQQPEYETLREMEVHRRQNDQEIPEARRPGATTLATLGPGGLQVDPRARLFLEGTR